jgi:FAD/FMN-containing dehydrogenase
VTVSASRPDTAGIARLALAQLRERISGRVIGPNDDDYDVLRTVMMGGIDRRPAVIVRVANDDDVKTVVNLARETGLDLAIRSGGHSSKGDSTSDGGIVLDLRDRKRLDIDPETKTAWAETGLTAGEVTTAAADHGLAIGFGDTGSVGIGGITTGGGVGYLVRKHGLTIDNVLAADIVTADGQLVRADKDTNADLFWAIRGGGGNFGVVTRFQYRLVDLPGIVGGILVLPVNAEIIERYIALSEEAPDELSSIANVMPVPPLPGVPEEWLGKLGIFALMTYAGEADAGQQALQPFRDLAKLAGLDAPIADMLRPMTYPEMYFPDDPDYHPLAVSTNMLLDRCDRPSAQKIMEHLEALDAPMRVAQLRVLGGAMARVRNDATAFAHRASPIMVNLAAFYEDEADKARKQAWLDGFASAIRQSSGGKYVNFVGDEGEAGVRAAYPPKTYERLAEIKRRYDPDNVFHLNQNIPPATA